MEMEDCNMSSDNSVFVDICNAFDFMKKEGYAISESFIGRDVYVVYRNSKIKQTVTITLPEPNEVTSMLWKWQIVISKKVFLFTKTFSVTDCLNFPSNYSNKRELMEYSQYIQNHLMPIIRGEKWV